MSHHPSYTMAALCTIGGLAAYSRARSMPSLIAGVGIGALYGIAGYRIGRNENYGHELAVVASTILAGSMVPRSIKSPKPVPLTLSVLSVGVGVYYVKKIWEYRS